MSSDIFPVEAMLDVEHKKKAKEVKNALIFIATASHCYGVNEEKEFVRLEGSYCN